ncbi:FG-GAP repeat protein [Halapricum desulfuricans]|uniref:FG-GAP repeat protein n=1 Tax=Halapricum desulfuricans TaxID=2841257 RepID=UPI003AB93DE6
MCPRHCNWTANPTRASGAAYVFTRSDGTWSQQAKLTANRGDGDDKFGSSIALAGDTALIGSEGDEEPDWDNAGSAYVFTRSDGAWSQQAKLTAYDSDEGDYFGNAVELAADTTLIGAERDNDPNGENGGSAYIFDIK